MCTVSMIGDHYRDIWKNRPQDWWPQPGQTVPASYPSIQEFNELKRQVEEMKELLKRAKKYDEDNGEPNCEMDEKVAFLRKVAKAVGVDLNDVLGEK